MELARDELEKAVEELAEVNKELIKRHSPWRSFLHGIMYGVGATVGAAIIFALAAGMLHQLSGINLFKPVVEQLLPYFDRSRTRPIYTEPASLPQAEYIEPTPIPTLSFRTPQSELSEE